MLTERFKNHILFTLYFIILTLSFQFNYFGAAPSSFFDDHQRSSESLILGRVIENKKNDHLASGGFLGRYKDNNNIVDFQYHAYTYSVQPDSDFQLYRSSAGFQGVFYTFIDSSLALSGMSSGQMRLFSMKLITSMLLTCTLLLFIFFVDKQLGKFSSLCTVILISYSQWIVVFSNNLYWMFFLIMSPFVFVSFYLQINSISKINFKYLYLLIFILFFIKSLAGYEYISTILLSIVPPIIFFALKDSWSMRLVMSRLFCLGSSALIGFLSALLMHLIQLSISFDSLSRGLRSIGSLIAKRTHGNPLQVHGHYRESLESDGFDVFLKYWNGKAFNIESSLGTVTFGEFIITLMAVSILGLTLTNLKNNLLKYKKINMATTVTLWFSILAPLSWYVLAKGHSFAHGHLNHVLWYVPFLLLGFAYFGFVISLLINVFQDYYMKNRIIGRYARRLTIPY